VLSGPKYGPHRDSGTPGPGCYHRPVIDLPPSAELAVRIVLIALSALVAIVALRLAVNVGVHHVVERRSATTGGLLTPAEVEGRVRTIGKLAVRVGAGVILVIAALMVLGELGIDIGPAIAGLGIVGIAAGLGAQTLIRDWLAGVFVVLENQYSYGDLVRVAGVEGTVEDFSLRRTLLRDADGSLHTVPNGQILVATRLSRSGGGQGVAAESGEPEVTPTKESPEDEERPGGR
jgi:small-conductance mechanosensitive channel